MSVTVATRGSSTARLGSTIVVAEPTGATINQRLRGGLFGFRDMALHVGPTVCVAAAAHAGTAVSVRRIDGALNYTPIKLGAADGSHPTLGQSGDYSYDFTILDAWIASHADDGADELIMSLNYCPQILGGNLAPCAPSAVPFALGGLYYRGPGSNIPNDNVALGTIAADVVDRTVTRCAFHGIDFNYVGLWNEPDLAYFDGDAPEWIAMYAEVAPAIKAIHPALKVGGPEIAEVTTAKAADWIEDWLTYCKANAIPVDFISWHSYSATGWALAAEKVLIDAAVTAADWEDPLGYVVGEIAGATIANWPGYAPPFGTSTTEKLTINDHAAAMLALQMLEAQSLGITRILYFCSQSLAVSALSGLFNAAGPLAAGNVYRLWQRMGEADVLVVTLDADPGIHALAAEGGDDGTIYVLLVSHHYRRGPTYPVTIEVPGANGRETTLTVIDRAHSNQWDAGIENAELQTVPVTDVANEQVRLTMQARSVCLLEIAP